MWRSMASLGLSVVMFSAGIAWARSPHFVSCALSVSESQVCVCAPKDPRWAQLEADDRAAKRQLAADVRPPCILRAVDSSAGKR